MLLDMIINNGTNKGENLLSDDDLWVNNLCFGMPTGCTPYDVATANSEKDEFGGKEVMNSGLFPRIYTAAGMSGGGKSTLTIQFICNAVDLWNRYTGVHGSSVFLFFDIEGHTTDKRIRDLSGWDEKTMMRSCRLYQGEVSLLDIYNEIRKVVQIKKDNPQLKQATPIVSIDNKLKMQYPTTYILIDSLAMVNVQTSEETFKKDMKGELKEEKSIVENIDAMRKAKEISNFLKKVKPLCIKYDISLMTINHITTVPAMSKFEVPPKSLPLLKNGEKLLGGDQVIYQSTGIIGIKYDKKLVDGDSMIYGDNVHGVINKLVLYKNKNGAEGVPYPIVFDGKTGYRFELSDFEYLYRVKYGITGTASYSMDILPEFKFSRKQLLELCLEHPIVARAIQFTSKLHHTYTSIYRDDPLDIKNIAERLPLEERLNAIMELTTDYNPFYRNYIMQERLKRDLNLAGDGKILFGNKDLKGLVMFDDDFEYAIKLYEKGYVRNNKDRFTLIDFYSHRKFSPKDKYMKKYSVVDYYK